MNNKLLRTMYLSGLENQSEINISSENIKIPFMGRNQDSEKEIKKKIKFIKTQPDVEQKIQKNLVIINPKDRPALDGKPAVSQEDDQQISFDRKKIKIKTSKRLLPVLKASPHKKFYSIDQKLSEMNIDKINDRAEFKSSNYESFETERTLPLFQMKQNERNRRKKKLTKNPLNIQNSKVVILKNAQVQKCYQSNSLSKRRPASKLSQAVAEKQIKNTVILQRLLSVKPTQYLRRNILKKQYSAHKNYMKIKTNGSYEKSPKLRMDEMRPGRKSLGKNY